MKRTRFLILALVLSFAVVASFEMTAVASGGADSAKKKCKKGYKRNKKGKCKKKKTVKALPGFFVGQLANGNGEIRLRLTPKLPTGKQYLSVFSGSATSSCSNGTVVKIGIRTSANVKGKAFSPADPNRLLAGSFKNPKNITGVVSAKANQSGGIACDTGAVPFTAKWAGK
jgi:hypothetical protein